MHALLRAATSSHHERAEACVDLERATASTAGYVALLAALHGFHRPLEARLRGSPHARELPFGLAGREARLAGDLRELGLAAEAIERLPDCADLPELASREQLAGCLYVVEGAELGGRVIARRVRARLGLGGAGLGFFSGCEPAGPRWRAVLDWLESLPGRGARPGAVVEAARATFDCFARWLREAP